MRRRSLVLAGSMCVFALSCGGNKNPNTPTVTVNSITVTFSGAAAIVGTTYNLSATASMSDGSQLQVTSSGQWSSSNTSVATVNAGVLTPTGAGSAMITVTYQGRTGSTSVRVVPRYQGEWLGSYTVTSCTETGAMVGAFCAGSAPQGRVLPVALQFTQDGLTVTGRTSLGSILSDTFTSPIGDDGTVVILTRASLSGNDVDQTWRVNSTTAGRITGTVTYRITNAAFVGSIEVRGDLFNTNLQAMASPMRVTIPRTLPDLLDAIVR